MVCRLNGNENRNVFINNVTFISRKVSIEKISTEEKKRLGCTDVWTGTRLAPIKSR